MSWINDMMTRDDTVLKNAQIVQKRSDMISKGILHEFASMCFLHLNVPCAINIIGD